MKNKIIHELVEKTFRELDQQPKPRARSRAWKSTNGYIYLVSWSNASLLRILVKNWLDLLKSSKSPLISFKLFDRLEAQVLDAARSVVANIEEGYSRPTTSEYLKFLGFSQASLKEVKGDIQRAKQDGLLKSESGSSLASSGINLKSWHEALKESVVSKPINSSKILQDPIKEITGNYRTLTYEVFIELINKTDWHMRKLVESLERKLNQEHTGYQIEKARIRGNLK